MTIEVRGVEDAQAAQKAVQRHAPGPLLANRPEIGLPAPHERQAVHATVERFQLVGVAHVRRRVLVRDVFLASLSEASRA